jgi:hypothetical protein
MADMVMQHQHKGYRPMSVPTCQESRGISSHGGYRDKVNWKQELTEQVNHTFYGKIKIKAGNKVNCNLVIQLLHWTLHKNIKLLFLKCFLTYSHLIFFFFCMKCNFINN